MNILDLSLEELSDVELSELNVRVVNELKLRTSEKCSRLRRAFKPGDVVSFVGNDRRRIRMTIDRINNKTVNGTELSPDGLPLFGRKWRVSLNLLQFEDA